MHPTFKIISDNSPASTHIKLIIPDVSDLVITVEQVLRAQGSDPAVLLKRRPELISMTEKAIQAVMEFADPQVYFLSCPITFKDHVSVHIGESVQMRGETIDRAVRPADAVIVAILTIGPAVEDKVSELFKEDPAYGMAMDTAASYFVDRMGAVLCQAIDVYVQTIGEKTGIPISPGAKDWDVKTGQTQVFALFSDFNLPITLNSSGMMTPHKSMSMLVPYGKHIGESGKPCDFCSMSETCKFKEIN